ncbi:uncharacterized protein METZ01_LOCUS511899, partial [marine metagenome]
MAPRGAAHSVPGVHSATRLARFIQVQVAGSPDTRL